MGMGIKIKKASKPFGLDALVIVVRIEDLQMVLQEALISPRIWNF